MSSAVEDMVTEKDASNGELDRLFRWPDHCRSLFGSLIDAFREGFFITDLQGSFLHVSPSLGRMVDYDSPELLRMGMRDVDVEGRFTEVAARFRRDPDGVATYETTWRRKDSGVVDVEVTIAGYSPPKVNGRFVGLVRHIGDRKKLETALKESEERFKLFSHASREALLLLNDEGNVLYVNPTALRITGRDEQEASGMAIHEFLRPFHYSDEQRLQIGVAETLPVSPRPEEASGSDRVLDLSITGRDGIEADIELSLLSEKVGDKWHMIALFRDVTEKKKALESLRKSEEKLRRLFEETKDAVFMTTPEGQIVDINKAGIELFGYRSKEDVLKLDIVRDLYWNPEDYANFRAVIERYGSASMHDLALRRADGAMIVVSITVNAVYDEVGNLVVYHGVMRDLTHIRQLEQQVRAFQKMDAVREIVGDMAHHFNNILNIIIGNAQLAKMSPDCSEEVGSYLSSIEEEVFRAADMVDELLASGSKHPMDMKTADLRAVVGDFEKVLRNVISEKMTLRVSLPASPVPARMDAARIGQALLNLVVNAREAMYGVGTLTIRVYTEELRDVMTALDGKIKPGPYAVISVSDTGRGIGKALREKIFEPFYTTDTSGEKKGLGLSVVLGIVKQHGGFVICDSEEGRGAIFKMYLPLSAEKAKAGQAAQQQDITGGSETILVGEDEDALRKIADSFLTALGYRVITARNGEDALAIFRGESGTIDLVLLDIAMPGMGGLDVYREIIKIRPDIAVLFMTGHSLDASNVRFMKQQGVGAIQKPFTMVTLAGKIREILDTGKTA